MKKPLQDFKKLKFINPEDRIAFIGCSTHPYDGNVKDIKNFFDKKFYFPFQNYATRKLLFKHFIEEKGVILPENFSLNTLAHMTDGYSAGSFKIACDKVLTKRRIEQINKPIGAEPLKVSEFVGPLSVTFYCSKQEAKEFVKFTDDVCQFKERREKRKPNEDEGKEKKGQAKSKK